MSKHSALWVKNRTNFHRKYDNSTKNIKRFEFLNKREETNRGHANLE